MPWPIPHLSSLLVFPPRSKAKGANGEVVIRLESGSATVKGSHWPAAAYIAASWDPYELIDR